MNCCNNRWCAQQWVQTLKLTFLCVCVFQVQPGWRSEVRRDRAGAGDRLTRTSTSRGSTTQRPLHSNTNTRSLQEIETTRQNVRKLQENWEYLKPNFDAVFSSFFFFFFATWVFFKMCLFSSVDKKKKSSSSVEAGVSDSWIFLSWRCRSPTHWLSKVFSFSRWGERRRTHRLSASSIRASGTKILHQPLSGLCAVYCVPHVAQVSCCVFFYSVN